jgi:hypothetical protein
VSLESLQMGKKRLKMLIQFEQVGHQIANDLNGQTENK